MSDRDGIYRVDRMRIWNHTSEFIARAEMRAPEGKMFVIQVIAVEEHPMPQANRLRRRPTPSVDAVDPHADSTGKPTPREKGSS